MLTANQQKIKTILTINFIRTASVCFNWRLIISSLQKIIRIKLLGKQENISQAARSQNISVQLFLAGTCFDLTRGVLHLSLWNLPVEGVFPCVSLGNIGCFRNQDIRRDPKGETMIVHREHFYRWVWGRLVCLSKRRRGRISQWSRGRFFSSKENPRNNFTVDPQNNSLTPDQRIKRANDRNLLQASNRILTRNCQHN